MTTKTAPKKAAKKATAKKATKPAANIADQQITLATEWHDLKAVETEARKPYDDAVAARQQVEEQINELLTPGLTFDIPGVGLRETSENPGKSVAYKAVIDALRALYAGETGIDGDTLLAKVDELIEANTTENPRITFKNAKA